MTIEDFLGRFEGVRKNASGWTARCPAHDDRRQSLSISQGEKGIVLKCFAGCETKDVLAKLGLKERDLFPREKAPARGSFSARRSGRPEAIYPYRNAQGRVLFEVLRFPGKDFRQRRPDPSRPGAYVYNLDGVSRVPYRLPELLQADPLAVVFIVEGEKDAGNLSRLGEVATTNPGGTGNSRLWETTSFWEPLRGRDVAILPDNDEPGRKHADRVARAVQGYARSVKVLSLPALPAKGDVSDWIRTGGTRERLAALVTACPPWVPPVTSSTTDTQPNENEEETGQKKSQTQRLLELASAKIELFRTPTNEPFASVIRCGVQETWPVDSEEFRLLLRRMFYEDEGGSAARNALADAVEDLKAQATFGSKVIPVELRTAQKAGAVYHDLGREDWRVVKITPNGWAVVPASECPIRFRRSANTLTLPVPTNGGELDDLRFFVNAGTDENFQMIVAWLTFAIAGEGPYPVLVIQGEQGSAKSTTTRTIASLVDPSESDLMIPPMTDEDLMIVANNCFVLAYDNLSGLSPRLSDGLSRVATGGAFTARKKYTDKGMSVMRVRRPIILNGIDQLAARHDLADRSIVIHLPAIPPANRRTEAEFAKCLDGHKARLLGSIYNAIVGALRELPEVREATLPRMADFGRWGVALERSQGWPSGSFMCAYGANLKESAATATEADPIFLALMDLMEKHEGRWEGTMGDLLKDLERLVSEKDRTSRWWPRSPQALSNRLMRLAPDLRREGWERAPLERAKRGRQWLIARVTGHSGESSSPASPSAIGQQISAHTGDEPSDKPVDAVRATSGVVTNGAEETAHQENVVTAVRLSVGDEDDKGDEVPPLLTGGKEGREDDSGSLPSAGGQP
jgi:hypothetical protein